MSTATAATTEPTERTFKVFLNNECRRFKLVTSPIDHAWSTFETKAFEFFDGDDLVFKWKDADGDLITITNADDFNEVLAEQATGPIRLHAFPSEEQSVSAAESTHPSPIDPLVRRTSSETEIGVNDDNQADIQADTAEEKSTLDVNPDFNVKPDDVTANGQAEIPTTADQIGNTIESSLKQEAVVETTAAVEAIADKVVSARAFAKAEAAKAHAAAKAAAKAEQIALEAEADAEAARVEAERKLPTQHPYITCDGSGESPLSGTRYHRIDHDFDLCEAEFAKLPESEKQQYEIILRPGSTPIRYEPVIHFGIVCGASNKGPIVGTRFHKIGEDYDLCQVEFSKLEEKEKRLYELIVHPRSKPVRYHRPPEPKLVTKRIIFPGGFFDIQLIDDCNMWKQQKQHQNRCGSHQVSQQKVAVGETLPEATSFGIGSYGPGVEQLQRFLISNHLLSPQAITWRAGVYGPWTRRAIAVFQNSQGLKVQELGRYDSITRAALLEYVNNDPDESRSECNAQGLSNNEQQASGEPRAANEHRQPKDKLQINDEHKNEEEQNSNPSQATQNKWADELVILNNMGFTDKDILTNLLEKKHGQIGLVVAEMLK